jgi:1-acyl-sn-glycerol-3-phosphate acyltransferase
MTGPGDAKPVSTTPLDSSITPMIAALCFGARLFSKAMTRVSVDGALDEIPREGPVIIAA